MDLAKAFDTIDHAILIKKMGLAGLDGTSLKLIQDYLKDRKQVVSINGHLSTESIINIGVPQGSILGPLMFLIFINDISQLPLFGKIYLFADDSSLFYPGQNNIEIKRKMERDLVIINEYFRLNRISMNAAKTKVIIFTSNRRAKDPMVIEFDQHQIPEIDCVKFLGLTIDRHLSWNEHCKNLISKISQGLGALYKFKNKFDEETKKMIYYACIHSHLTYCTALWGESSLSRKIQTIQNKALRVVYSCDRRSNRLELYLMAEILPLNALFRKQTCSYIYKSMNNQNGIVQPFGHKHNTRGKRDAKLPRNRLEMTAQRISVNGSTIYNQIPRTIRSEKTVNRFNMELRRYLRRPTILNNLLYLKN